MNEKEPRFLNRVEYAAGQIAAIEPLIRALIRTHANVNALADCYEQSQLMQSAMTLPLTVSVDYLQGQSDQAEAIEALLSAAKGEQHR